MADSKLFKRSRVILDDQSYVLRIPKKGYAGLRDKNSGASNNQENATNSSQLGETNVDGFVSEELTELTNPHSAQGMEKDNSSIVSNSSNQQMEPNRITSEIIKYADAEAERIIKNAKNSSEAIIIEAYDQADKIRIHAENEGRQQGYDDGHKEGYEEIKSTLEEEYREKFEQVEIMRKELEQKKATLYKDTEKEIIDLVLTTVDKVFQRRRESDEYLIETLIKQAVSRISKSETIIIRVSDVDYPIAIASRNRLLNGSERIDNIEFKSDSSLIQGSCIIESENGMIDSSLHSQLEEIKHTFIALLNEDR